MITPVSSNHVTTGTLIKTGPSMLVAVVLTAGTGAAAVTNVYDNTAASGTILTSLRALTGESVVFTPCQPLVADTGIYGDVSGTGAVLTIVYA